MKIKTRLEEDHVMVGGVCVGSVSKKSEWVMAGSEILPVDFWFAYCKGSAARFRTREKALKYMWLALDHEDGFVEVKWNNSNELRTETETIGNVFNDGTWVANPYNREGKDGFETIEEAMAALEKMLEVVK